MPAPVQFSLERVTTQKVMREEWFPLLKEIFPDKDDQEPLRQLNERLKQTDQNTFYILRDKDNGNKAVGIELRQVDPGIPGSMYVPWAGVTEPYRNRGIYPYMSDICDAQMKEAGAKYNLFEVEDPKRILVAYPDEDPATVTRLTESRINFWRRSGNGKTFVVRDPDIDYIRPASSDDKKIQGYDLLSFRVLDAEDPMWKDVFNADKTAISKAAYRKFYMEMTRLQYGNKPEAELRQELPAVDQMLNTLDKSPKQWLQLETTQVRPNLSLNPDVDMQAVAPARRGKNYLALPPATDNEAPAEVAKTHAIYIRALDYQNQTTPAAKRDFLAGVSRDLAKDKGLANTTMTDLAVAAAITDPDAGVKTQAQKLLAAIVKINPAMRIEATTRIQGFADAGNVAVQEVRATLAKDDAPHGKHSRGRRGGATAKKTIG